MASERQANARNSPWWGEHLHRYQFVKKELGSNESVLDLACGSGYGTHFLSEATQGKVVGGDLSAETIGQCVSDWPNRSNLEFRQLNGTSIEFPESAFDKVVSFETIEHTVEFEKLLSELNRVLKPGGKAFISTPNFPVNSPSGKVTNPYHTQEFKYEEFRALMERHFSDPLIFGQKYTRYETGNSLFAWIAKLVERVLYLRGVRKLPLFLRDFFMRILIGKPLYPLAEDFSLVAEEADIRRCKTFVATGVKK